MSLRIYHGQSDLSGHGHKQIRAAHRQIRFFAQRIHAEDRSLCGDGDDNSVCKTCLLQPVAQGAGPVLSDGYLHPGLVLFVIPIFRVCRRSTKAVGQQPTRNADHFKIIAIVGGIGEVYGEAGIRIAHVHHLLQGQMEKFGELQCAAGRSSNLGQCLNLRVRPCLGGDRLALRQMFRHAVVPIQFNKPRLRDARLAIITWLILLDNHIDIVGKI